MQSSEDSILIPSVWLSLWFGDSRQKLIGMTDIDFRRLASLLFALRLIGVTTTPIVDGVDLAEELLKELQSNE